ncbi:TPA: DUF2780 domain-containing protein [Vibrio campbellii]|uniref:DUF2780 domain-containing protein n=1 Tax=Vibrio campbellii TaxID=680 RepID=UPI00390C238D
MINTLAKTAMPAILLVGCHSTKLLETEHNVLNQTIEATSLTTQLANSLSLSNTQFIGGSAALLSLAQNTLNEHNQQELNTLIPSLPILGYAQDLTKSLDSMEEVQSTFSQLGLNTYIW